MWFRPAPFHAKIRKCIGPPKWRPRLRTVRIPSEPQTIPASERRTARICREHAARPSRFRHPRKFSWQFLMAFIFSAPLSRQFSWQFSHANSLGRSRRTTGPLANETFVRPTTRPIRVGSRPRSPEIGCQEHAARWRRRWHVYSGATVFLVAVGSLT